MKERQPSLESARALLRGLLGGLPDGAVLAGWHLVHIEVDDELAYRFSRDGHLLELRLAPLDDPAPYPARSRSFKLGYDREGTLEASAGALLDAVIRLVAIHDDGTAARRLATAGRSGGGEVRRERAEAFLSPTQVDGVPLYVANPYVGCLIGCSFCFQQSRVSVTRRLGLLDDLPWGRFVVVKENAAELLDTELERLPPRPVMFGPLVADVYQPIERKERLTRRCLEVLARRQVKTYVLTRSTLILDDLPLLASMPEVTAGFSLPTNREEVSRAYERRASSVAARLAALERMRAAGIRTIAVVAPLLPLDPEPFAERLAQACHAVRVDPYRSPEFGEAPLPEVNDHRLRLPEAPQVLAEELLGALRRRGVTLWTHRLPPT